MMIAVLALLTPALSAQEAKAGADSTVAEKTTSGTPVRVQIVLTEFDGSRKISSLPYSIDILGGAISRAEFAHLRYGVRVPIAIASGSNGGNSITYQDVGTNIDCRAIQREDGTYRLDITTERSSVSTASPNGTETEWKPGNSRPSEQPLIRAFRDNFSVVVKDGQTVEGTSAVDPITGHVLKVNVTLTVLK
jgi:hypothetical protein